MKIKLKINGKEVSRRQFLKNRAPAGPVIPRTTASYAHESMAFGVHPTQVNEANAHAAKLGFGDVQYKPDGLCVMKEYNPKRWREYLKAHGAHESGMHG